MMTMALGDRAQLALDTTLGKPSNRIPTKFLLIMEHAYIDRIAGAPPGSYVAEPEKTYCAMLENAGTCMCDQYIPRNPLTMASHGYEGKEKEATTGAEEIVVDDMHIDSPEAVVEHMEKVLFPRMRQEAASYDEDARVARILANEARVQEELGPNILKAPYGIVKFPEFRYGTYGYASYFMAYALYPELMEKDFSLQADCALAANKAAARAYREGNLPPLARLDYDMADSRGTLVNIASLDRIWFPQFVRCLEPMFATDVRMIWHCDGNLMEMVPRLLDVGLHGFQGFQYEDGMDYERICRMKTKDGDPLVIWAGVSVTRTLPYGTPDDVRKEIDWLVEEGPKTGLSLGCSSSMTPGVPWKNVEAMLEGFRYYREHGR